MLARVDSLQFADFIRAAACRAGQTLNVHDIAMDVGVTDDTARRRVAQAAKHHSSKADIGTPLEEIVKDADVLDCYQYGLPLDREEQRQRLKMILAEIG